VTVQLLDKQDPTFDDETMGADARWSYYVASYIKVDPTEGVPLDSRFQMPFFKRNLPDDHDEADALKQLPHCYEANLHLRICVNSYKILWQPGTDDWFFHSERHRASGGDAERVRQRRNALFRDHCVERSNALANMDEAERIRAEERYRSWIDGGPGPQ
jgi:paired amphipathic helix protein Sin3a